MGFNSGFKGLNMDSITAILVAKEPLRVRQAITCNLYGQVPRGRSLFRMELLDKPSDRQIQSCDPEDAVGTRSKLTRWTCQGLVWIYVLVFSPLARNLSFVWNLRGVCKFYKNWTSVYTTPSDTVHFTSFVWTWFLLITKIETDVCIHSVFFFFCCGAATQRGSWPPHSSGF